jgi:YD repeat-containing protein
MLEFFAEGSACKIYTYLLRPIRKEETYYNPNTGKVILPQSINYTYTEKKIIRSISQRNSNSEIYKTEYKYPFDFSGNSVFNQMTNNNMFSQVVEQNEYKNNELLKSTRTEYKNWESNLIEPETINIRFATSGQLENQITYHKRDLRGNPQYISKNGTENTVYLWGYSYLYPIAEIKNATYSEVTQYINETTLNNIAGRKVLTSTDSTNINNLRTQLPKAQVTTYTYSPFGLQTLIDPRGIATRYFYDNVGRLSEIKDDNNEIIEGYKYHYKNQ